MEKEWNSYLMVLNKAGFGLSGNEDVLVWDWKGENGILPAKKSYEAISKDRMLSSPKWWAKLLWKPRIHLKLKCFLWLCLENKILTWDNLLKRGFTGPGLCLLCKENEETISHLFIHCSFYKSVWVEVCKYLNIKVFLQWFDSLWFAIRKTMFTGSF